MTANVQTLGSAQESASSIDYEQLFAGIRREERLNTQLLHLTANETYMSETARAFLGSRLGDRYYMGGGDADGVVDFQPFTFRGLRDVQVIVTAAEEAAKRMLGACSVNFGCLSGIHAMMCAILSTTDPGDTVMSIDLAHGGHFATQGIIERMGRRQVPTSYDFARFEFDAPAIARTFEETGATALYLDASFYLSPHNIRAIRDALGPAPVLIYDASHTLGLILGQRFQAPLFEGADVVCGNTHKTLPGPQKGLIAFGDPDLAERANAVINSGLYSSSHTTSVIALAIAILEMERFGAEFADQVVANSNALGSALHGRGFHVRAANTGRWSENHQVHLLTERLGHYRDLYARLARSRLVVNFDRALGGGPFIRLGTQELTRRGMQEPEMETVSDFLERALEGDDVSEEVSTFVARFQRAHFSFD